MRPIFTLMLILLASAMALGRGGLIDEQAPQTPVSATLMAFDVATGTTRSILQLEGQSVSAPVVLGDTIFIANSAKKVLSLDSATGHIKWEYTTNRPVFSLLVTPKTLLVGAGGSLIALDPASGSLQWTFQNDMALLDLAFADGLIVINSIDGPVAIDSATGKIRWRLNVQWGYFVISPVADHRLCVWKPDEIYVVDTETGKTLWKSTADMSVSAPGALPSPAVAAADVICQLRCSRKDPRDWSLVALDAGSGNLVWKTNVGDFHGAAARTLIAGNAVYCLLDETVFALDLKTGEKKWQAVTKPLETNGAGLSANANTLFLPQIGGNLLALDAKTGQRKWLDESTAPSRKNSAQITGLVFASNTAYVSATK